jgi:hypothetical protein
MDLGEWIEWGFDVLQGRQVGNSSLTVLHKNDYWCERSDQA